jgi:hypothetical protein
LAPPECGSGSLREIRAVKHGVESRGEEEASARV